MGGGFGREGKGEGERRGGVGVGVGMGEDVVGLCLYAKCQLCRRE